MIEVVLPGTACPSKWQDIYPCQRPAGHEGDHVHTSTADGRSVGWPIQREEEKQVGTNLQADFAVQQRDSVKIRLVDMLTGEEVGDVVVAFDPIGVAIEVTRVDEATVGSVEVTVR